MSNGIPDACEQITGPTFLKQYPDILNFSTGHLIVLLISLLFEKCHKLMT